MTFIDWQNLSELRSFHEANERDIILNCTTYFRNKFVLVPCYVDGYSGSNASWITCLVDRWVDIYAISD